MPPTQPPPDVDVAERVFQSHLPHLWPWAGWYAVVVGDQFAGVFPGRAEAVLAAVAACGSDDVDAADVLVRRIGPSSAVAVPAADGGRPTLRLRVGA